MGVYERRKKRERKREIEKESEKEKRERGGEGERLTDIVAPMICTIFCQIQLFYLCAEVMSSGREDGGSDRRRTVGGEE